MYSGDRRYYSTILRESEFYDCLICIDDCVFVSILLNNEFMMFSIFVVRLCLSQYRGSMVTIHVGGTFRSPNATDWLSADDLFRITRSDFSLIM